MSLKEKILTIQETCEKFGLTRQAILLAIRSKRLNAVKIKGKWRFSPKDWQDYQSSKYDRKHSIRNGKPLYDMDNGFLSPCMVAKEFGVSTQHMYYLIRKDLIPYSRNGSAYVLNRKEMIKNSVIITDAYTKKPSALKRRSWK